MPRGKPHQCRCEMNTRLLAIVRLLQLSLQLFVGLDRWPYPGSMCFDDSALSSSAVHVVVPSTAASEGVGKFNLKNRGRKSTILDTQIHDLGVEKGGGRNLGFSQIQKWFGRCG